MFITTSFIFFFVSTWAGVYSIVSEIYPLSIRSKDMAVTTAGNWAWGFMISFVTTDITNEIQFVYGFVFFGCICFATVFTYFFVYETKGLSLEIADQLYASGIPAWKTGRNM